MLDNIKKYNIVLSSNSPRRRELLSGLGLEFVVKTVKDADESYPSTLRGEDIPIHISQKKAEAYRPLMLEDELVITADTIVYVDGQVLGKPVDKDDAERMLRLLSGREHEVITGVTIMDNQRSRSFAVTSIVTFSSLSTEEMDYYIDNYRPFDKAGAYGVQEWIGFVGVRRIEGSYFNVMGLPVQRLYEELCNWA